MLRAVQGVRLDLIKERIEESDLQLVTLWIFAGRLVALGGSDRTEERRKE